MICQTGVLFWVTRYVFYFYVSSSPSFLVFTTVITRSLCNCLEKKVNHGTDVFSNKQAELPASSQHSMCSRVQGGTCHVCIRGCACHVFGSEISLESHFWGSKICNMNFPILGGKRFQQLSFLLDSIL